MPSNLRPTKRTTRRGAIAVMTAVLIPILIGFLAFAIDCGYLLRSRADLQRAADAAALAAVRELVPDDNGRQDLLAARAKVREYTEANLEDMQGFTVLDGDIQIGRYDPATIYSNVTLLNSGVFDTVRVTLRRDSSANGEVPLFFAGIFGVLESEVSATGTAVLRKAKIIPPGTGILPFTIPEQEWRAARDGDVWNVYGNGQIRDGNGRNIPGNWGTVDIGNENNSTSDLSNQIRQGLRQSDLDALHNDGRIPQNTHIDSGQPFDANADPGLSAGMKHAVQDVHGEYRLIPIVEDIPGNNGNGGGGGKGKKSAGGNNHEFHITGWAVCKLIDSVWQGSKKTQVNIMKSHVYNGMLTPIQDLSDVEDAIEGAFTTPALVE